MFRIQTNARSACFRYNCVTKCEAGVTRIDCGDENAYARRYRASLVVLGSGEMWGSSALPGPASRVRAKIIMRAHPELSATRAFIRAEPTKQLRLILLLGTLMIGTIRPAWAASGPPNILFIIMDDVGIDQLLAFNPLARVATPNIDTVIAHGVRFTRDWTMPECSPSRACFFTGRYPLRTGVEAAILSYALPSSQVSPYEITTPQILAHAGYNSALIGKFHLGGPDNNPAGFRTPSGLGR